MYVHNLKRSDLEEFLLILGVQHLVDLFFNVLAHCQADLEFKGLNVSGDILCKIFDSPNPLSQFLVFEFLHRDLDTILVYLELNTISVLVKHRLKTCVIVFKSQEASCAVHNLSYNQFKLG